jgi:hypothetical protein
MEPVSFGGIQIGKTSHVHRASLVLTRATSAKESVGPTLLRGEEPLFGYSIERPRT